MKGYWRPIAARAIQEALKEAREQGLDEQQTEKHIDAAYPFGERAYHPYKIWLSEKRRWLGRVEPKKIKAKKQAIADGQMELF